MSCDECESNYQKLLRQYNELCVWSLQVTAAMIGKELVNPDPTPAKIDRIMRAARSLVGRDLGEVINSDGVWYGIQELKSALES